MFDISDINHPSFVLSDFLEYRSLVGRPDPVSISSLRAAMAAPDDELSIGEDEEGDDNVINKLADALNGCASRRTLFGDNYPFSIGENTVSLNSPLNTKWYIYIFLLLSNRLNMNKENIQGGKDATKLFEKLCQLVAKAYFGANSKCEVFGTSVAGSFKDKVEDILRKLYISGGYKTTLGCTGSQKDGGIDIIAWIPFGDTKDSQLIALGQCKTGSNWEGYLRKAPFFDNYSNCQPFVGPVYMFYVSEYFDEYKWEERSRLGGILFDRYRIMSCIPDDIDETAVDLVSDIKIWVNAALDV